MKWLRDSLDIHPWFLGNIMYVWMRTMISNWTRDHKTCARWGRRRQKYIYIYFAPNYSYSNYTYAISNQRSTLFAHHSIIFLKQQITANITPSYANPHYITDRCSMKKIVSFAKDLPILCPEMVNFTLQGFLRSHHNSTLM